ncbi:MAG: sialate O-acetylesterase [Opitutaceae bacterium]|nr:sialate O-acetylesterase [Opitutaceae bacterium]
MKSHLVSSRPGILRASLAAFCIRRATYAAVLLAAALRAHADVTLAPLFRDGAVLQRGQAIAIFGRAAPAEKVQVKFGNQTVAVTTPADGHWKAMLKPLKISAQPAELVVTGTNTVRVRDVLVGDVWLCSGQSNMGFIVRNAERAEAEIAAANFPLIRQFKVTLTAAEQPKDDVKGDWAPCSPATVGNFSAVAFFFARDLHQKLQVPIGIVNSSWGGTQIESWMSEPMLRANPAAKGIFARWEKTLADFPARQTAHAAAMEKWKANQAAAKAAGQPFTARAPVAPEGPGSRWLPASLYNGMIAPLVPYGLAGAIWYQGESNAARHAEYSSLFTDMIKQWRREFDQPLPFYFVQLANFESGAGNTGDVWAYLREAQTRALALPKTGMAVTIDIGAPKDIHPKNKQDVGHRLALHARQQLFREKIETDGPLFKAAKRDGKGMRVSFTHAAGLRLDPAKDDGLISFEVAGEDRKFVSATARVDGQAVIVSADSVAQPVAVRYAWRNSPDARLFNGAGLPAAPFRSDNW